MTIRDYLIWRGDVPLSVSPFNPVDALILSYVIYSHFHGVGEGSGHPLRRRARRRSANSPRERTRRPPRPTS